MFGIGFPELILILALALVVVGPDKLPELARSIAKTLVDLKKTAEGLKDSIEIGDNPLSEIKPELEDAAKNFKETILDAETGTFKQVGNTSTITGDTSINQIYDDYANKVSDGEALAADSAKAGKHPPINPNDEQLATQKDSPSTDVQSKDDKDKGA